MSLHTYGGIKADILRELSRTGDPTITDRWPAFTQMAEARIFLGGASPLRTEPLRVSQMETPIDLVVTDGVATLPIDFLEARSLYWYITPRAPIHYRAPNEFHLLNGTSARQPVIYTIEDEQMKFAPEMSGTAKLVYYARPAALSADADTNWLMPAAPSVYREALMVEVQRHLRQDVSSAFAAYKSAVEGLMHSDFRSRTSGRPLYPRVPFADVRSY